MPKKWKRKFTQTHDTQTSATMYVAFYARIVICGPIVIIVIILGTLIPALHTRVPLPITDSLMFVCE